MVKPLLFVCYLVAVECLLFLFFTLVPPPPYILLYRREKSLGEWVDTRPTFGALSLFCRSIR